MAKETKHRMLKVTISGSYYNSKKEKVDYDKVTGVIPWCDEDQGLVTMHVQGRYVRKWIKDAVDAPDMFVERPPEPKQESWDDMWKPNYHEQVRKTAKLE